MTEKSNVKGAKLIKLPKVEDLRGSLTYLEEGKHIPFKIERIYWIYDVPGGEVRGGHAFIKQVELIVALSGSLDVKVDNGIRQDVFSLNRSYFGIYIPAGCWRQMSNFSTNSLALVVSSTPYDEEDYIRDYQAFLKYISGEEAKCL